MASELTPEGLRQARFRSAFRGVDPAEVESTLHAVANRLEQLETEKAKLEKQLADTPGHDLGDELEALGHEVTAILQRAREAAEAMRERASLDATRWRGEAMEEADATLKAASGDAEALRRDAWVTGSELLEQTTKSAERMRAEAERDVLTVMGEAEREAHRLTSSARRDAEDLLRNATMEAEKINADATKRRDEIIDGANRQAASAQERTRALEQRRDELLEELENVRSTLTRLEGSLEERREALDLTTAAEPSSVRVVHPPSEAKKQWELGETVRVVPPGSQEKPEPEVTLADEMSEQVARMRRPESPSVEEPDTVGVEPHAETGEPAAEEEPEPAVPVPVEPEPAMPEPEPVAEHEEADNDVEALFASLRGSADESRDSGPAPLDEVEETSEEAEAIDWIQIREERLLPITNRALRGVKKAMTEVQNVALDSLRTEDEWKPDDAAIATAVHAELLAVWSESFAAGHAVAEEMGDTKLKRPTTPPSDADTVFATDLAEAVSKALEKAGEGQRERQSAASRVFRVWRSDEAERRVRDIALKGYEAGLEESRKVQAVS